MKLLNKKGFVQKILIVLISITLMNFVVPLQSQASDSDIGGKLFKPIFQFLSAVADVPIGLLHHTMLGTNLINNVTLNDDDYYNVVEEKGIWHDDSEAGNENLIRKKVKYGEMQEGEENTYDGYMDDDGMLWKHAELEIPNILYCPEYIFANRIAALDVNFVNPGKYKGGYEGVDQASIISGEEGDEATLSKTVASWYRAFRNVAVVGLLSILVYIGIRILIGSTAQDKAKYKERLKDWFVGLCLLFVMHYIMAGTMMITEVITNNLDPTNNDNYIYVTVDGYDPGWTHESKDLSFKTNFMGYIRFMVQSSNAIDACAYLIMYIALVIYTVMFTITYLKRVLYMAFFTMIAPLVAMTYPLDKLSDGKAQGFNMWMREYMMNAIIQPVHLILYTVLMGNLMDLATKNLLYGLVAIGFLLPAEKFIKKMFRFDRGETTSTLGAVAGGALAMKGVQNLSKLTGGSGKDSKIRTADNKELASGKRGKNDGIKSPEEVLALEGANLAGPGSNPGGAGTGNPGGTGADESGAGGNGSGGSGAGGTGSNGSSPERYTAEQRALDRQKQMAENDGQEAFHYSYYDPDQGRYIDDYNPNDDMYFNRPEFRGDRTTPYERFEEYANERGLDLDKKYYNPHTKQYEDGYDPTKDMKLLVGERDENAPIFKDDGGEDPLPQPSRFRRAAGALGGYAMRSAQRTFRDLPGRLKDKAISGAKTLPGNLARMGAKAMGAAAVGAVAAGAALTTGDLKSAASMAAGGAMLGSKVGGAAGNRPAQALDDGIANASEVAKSAWYTEEDKQNQEAKRRQKFDEEWKLKEDNYKYLRGKDMNDKQAKKFLEDANTQKFLDAGITDINIIHNARKMMDDANKKQAGSMTINGAVARAQLAKSTAENFSNSATQQEAFKKNMKSKNPNLDETQLNKLVDQIIKIKKTD